MVSLRNFLISLILLVFFVLPFKTQAIHLYNLGNLDNVGIYSDEPPNDPQDTAAYFETLPEFADWATIYTSDHKYDMTQSFLQNGILVSGIYMASPGIGIVCDNSNNKQTRFQLTGTGHGELTDLGINTIDCQTENMRFPHGVEQVYIEEAGDWAYMEFNPATTSTTTFYSLSYEQALDDPAFVDVKHLKVAPKLVTSLNTASFSRSYGVPIFWILGIIIFLGFSKAIFVIIKAIWKFFKKNLYEI